MSKEKILVVDDEKDIIAPLEMYLKSNGYTIVTASDGIEALKVAEEENPDLILLDIIMPKMDGFTALRKLKANEKTKSIPVIMLTVKENMKDLCEGRGAEGYVLKPFERKELLERIKKILEKKDT